MAAFRTKRTAQNPLFRPQTINKTIKKTPKTKTDKKTQENRWHNHNKIITKKSNLTRIIKELTN